MERRPAVSHFVRTLAPGAVSHVSKNRTDGPRKGRLWPARRHTWAAPGLHAASADPLASMSAWIGPDGTTPGLHLAPNWSPDGSI